MTTLSIIVALPGGSEETWGLDASDEPPWEMRLVSSDGREWLTEGRDLFDALRNLRGELDPLGVCLCCNGARVNAHASRMSSDMGGGRRIYLLKRKRQAKRRDLVDLFDPAPCAEVAGVIDQDRFYDDWLESLG